MASPRNRLAGETSPYLLQHARNPVDWYPWGDEAFEAARREDRPIFLSIGYAACHWCHVMERESFEDPAIAAILNRNFVAIKVDREERPDLDEIYMSAVQLMTRHGGWPLSVFLTPDGRPFLGGTYFPPETTPGRIGFPDLLERVRTAWSERRGDIERAAGEVLEHLRTVADGGTGGGSGGPVGRTDAAAAAYQLSERFDVEHGGFGPAPKFPPDQALAFLLREHAAGGEAMPLRMVETTLDAMALGGMYDHVGGGFARYSVDERWLVPHFEKMLYNQALLVPVYVDAHLVTGKPLYRRVALETLDFVRRELRDPTGGLWSSLDADSEGEEGRFYLWTPEEVRDLLGREDAEAFCRIYDVTPGGNFEGRSIPNLLGGDVGTHAAELGVPADALEARMASARARLLEARARRTRPATDDKVLTAWNGLMVTAFSRGAQAFGRPEDVGSARAAADFALAHQTRHDRLLASYRDGVSRLNGYLDDHAFLARGLVDLYETCFERRYLDRAAALARAMLRHFEDGERGGFWFTSDDHETVLARVKSAHDGALPAGAGVAVEVLARLGALLDDDALRSGARRALEAYRPSVERMASAHASLLIAAAAAGPDLREVAIVGRPSDPRTAALIARAHRRFLPQRVIAMADPDGTGERLPWLRGKSTVGGVPAAWVCREYACSAPVTDPDDLDRLLRGA